MSFIVCAWTCDKFALANQYDNIENLAMQILAMSNIMFLVLI